MGWAFRHSSFGGGTLFSRYGQVYGIHQVSLQDVHRTRYRGKRRHLSRGAFKNASPSCRREAPKLRGIPQGKYRHVYKWRRLRRLLDKRARVRLASVAPVFRRANPFGVRAYCAIGQPFRLVYAQTIFKNLVVLLFGSLRYYKTVAYKNTYER